MAEPIHRYAFEGVDGAPDVEITWTHEDQEKALAGGWYLDEEDGAIQPDPDQPFQAEPAQVVVSAQASAGSELHIRAVILDGWAALGAWERRYREATGQQGDWHAS